MMELQIKGDIVYFVTFLELLIYSYFRLKKKSFHYFI